MRPLWAPFWANYCLEMAAKPQFFEELVDRYGCPWQGTAEYHEFEQKHMTLWRSEVWEDRQPAGQTWTLPFKRIYCNRDLLPLLDMTFDVLYLLGLQDELKTFDGCLNVRPIRGTEESPRWSIHSFGLAVDFNASTNPLGGPVSFSPRFLAAMKACGWTCGASFRRADGMHFQWADNC